MTTAKQVNDVLRSKRNARHADKRVKAEKKIENEKLREFLDQLRKSHGKDAKDC